MTKESNLVVSTASGVTRNGRVWYKLNGKFCSKRTYDMAKELEELGNYIKELESSKVPAKKATTKWDGDINPTLLLIVAVIVFVFVVILGCIMLGDAKIAYCGVYKPWKWNASELWFVEDTCKYIHFTPKE